MHLSYNNRAIMEAAQ
ncbi:hypothetical protein SOVF_080600, partial [Spinacia oleracea]